MTICPRCGKENDPENRNCTRCGLEFAKVVMTAPPADDSDVLYCYKHPREATRLTCGKCERPICTRCAVNGPAGMRCKECAKLKIKVTARGIAHDTTRPIMATISHFVRQPFGIIVMLALLSGLVRGCMYCAPSGGSPERIIIEQPDEPAGKRTP